MATGRGAWTTIGGTTPYYELHDPNVGSQVVRDVSMDPNCFDYRAVNLAVAAYQARLNELGYTPVLEVDGWFGPATQAAVKWAQNKFGLVDGYTPGRIGQDLSKALFKQIVVALSTQYGIPNNLLGGLWMTESSCDMGAVGYLTPYDKGGLQFNCDPATNPRTWWNIDSKSYTIVDAFNYRWTFTEGAKRLQWAKGRYAGKGATLQIQCMAAQHNAPAWADSWFRNGVAPNDTIKKYVSTVLVNAQNF